MNTKLHQQAKKYINKSKADEMDLTSLDIDQLIDSIDPALWSMIINLTPSHIAESYVAFTAYVSYSLSPTISAIHPCMYWSQMFL